MNMKNEVRAQSGFSLVELMVAMVLGLVLIGGVIQVVISNIQTFNANSGISRVQEGARFALTELSRNIRSVGFKGCDSKGADIQNYSGNALYNLGVDFVGYNNVTAAVAGVTPTGVTPVSGSDIIQIKQLVDEGVYLTSDAAASATQLTVSNGTQFSNGDVLFIGDCEKGAVVSVTGTTANTVTVSAKDALNNPKPISPNGEAYGVDAVVLKVEVKTYYIAPSTYQNNAGNAVNALFVKVNSGAAQELVLGVDKFQVLYGIGTASSFTPNQYVAAPTAGQMANMSVVQLMVETTSFDTVGSSGVLRREFALSVLLRNRMVTGV